jgi:hypothetical protein
MAGARVRRRRRIGAEERNERPDEHLREEE